MDPELMKLDPLSTYRDNPRVPAPLARCAAPNRSPAILGVFPRPPPWCPA